MATATAAWSRDTTVRGAVSTAIVTFSEEVSGLSISTVNTIPSEWTITGDLITDDGRNRFRYSSNENPIWHYLLQIPLAWGPDGGSFRMRLAHDAVTPNLDEDFDWTLSWNARGETIAERTVDRVFPELAITLSETYVAIGTVVTATFTFTEVGAATLTNFTADDVVVTEGVTKGVLTKVSNTVYTMLITAPASGNGEAVISVAADVVRPRNTAAAARLTYIDSINADISLSAASVESGGLVIAQFDFDYDVPDFDSDFVAVNDAGAVVGNATALDDQNRRWAVPVTVPETGEGEVEISLPEDAIGFAQPEVRAPVQFAETIPLSIGSFMTPIEAVIDHNLNFPINIRGNNVNFVDIQGKLRPFYPHWDQTKGVLYIRGRSESYYEELGFTIIARDDNAEAQAEGSINVVDLVPVIRPPDKIQFVKGLKNSILIPIDNRPSEGAVEGSWMGIDHEISEIGVRIFGDIPADAEAAFGMGSSGNFLITALNRGGDAIPKMVPWEFTTPTPPNLDVTLGGFLTGFREIYLETGTHYSLRLLDFVSGVPGPTLALEMGEFGEFSKGLSFDEETTVISGTLTSLGRTPYFTFKVENPAGATTSRFRFTVLAAGSIPVPVYRGPSNPGTITARAIRSSVLNFFQTWFNTNRYTSVSANAQDWELIGIDDPKLYARQYRHQLRNTTPLLRFTKGISPRLQFNQNNREALKYRGTSHRVQIKLSNYRGSVTSPEFTLNFT